VSKITQQMDIPGGEQLKKAGDKTTQNEHVKSVIT
jgi:hypothetical protein